MRRTAAIAATLLVLALGLATGTAAEQKPHTAMPPSAARPVATRPAIVQRPIPFGARRRQEMREYAQRHTVGPGWTFLTGDAGDLELLRRRLGFADPDPARDADRSNHTGMVRYGNEPLHLWAAFPGMSRAEAIAKEILWVDWPTRSGPTRPAGSPPR